MPVIMLTSPTLTKGGKYKFSVFKTKINMVTGTQPPQKKILPNSQFRSDGVTTSLHLLQAQTHHQLT